TTGSDLFDLTVFELHRSWTPEDRYFHLEAGAFFVNFFHDAVEAGKGTVGNANAFTNFKADGRLGMLNAFLHLLQDGHGFLFGDRRGLVICAQETGHLRCILDQMESLICQIHLHQDVTREELALGVDLAAATHFHDLFGRDDHVFEQMIKLGLCDLFLDRVRNLALEVRVRLNNVPALGHAASPLLVIRLIRLADRKHHSYKPGNDLISEQEEQARKDHKDQNHDGRDDNFIPTRPGDLADFRTDLLKEGYRVGTGHWQFDSVVLVQNQRPRRDPHGWIGGYLFKIFGN